MEQNEKNTQNNSASTEDAEGAKAQAAAPEGSAPAETVANPVDEWKNRATYLAAEIENMRKRFAREKADVIRFANEEVLKTVLPILDNLQLAVKAVKDAEARPDSDLREPHQLFAKLLQGIDMTVKHFEQTLERSGVQTVSTLGQSFDPQMHEAIAQSESAEHKEGEITAELQKGYMLNGRLIRPARVVVNKAVSKGQA